MLEEFASRTRVPEGPHRSGSRVPDDPIAPAIEPETPAGEPLARPEPLEVLADHLRATVAPIAEYLGCGMALATGATIEWLATSGGCSCSRTGEVPCPVICGAWRRHAESRVVSCDGAPIGAVWLCSLPESELLRPILHGLVAAAETQVEREHRDAALTSEIEFGSQIQQDLLCDRPPRELGFAQTALMSIASRQLGGDFIEFFPHDDHLLDFVIGDVMGKGIKAAMLGLATHRQIARALYRLRARDASQPDPSEPAEIVTAASREVTPRLIAFESFVTVCLARFDARRQRLEFVHCGHMPIIHYRRDLDRCVRLQGESMPLGFSLSEVHTQRSVAFSGGDIFVFYSDGLTEARNLRGAMFGIARLEDIIQGNSHRDADSLMAVIHEAVVEFTGCPSFDDDLTCAVVKIAGETGSARPTRVFAEARSDLSELDHIRAFVRQVGGRHARPPLDDQRLDLLELAVNEAASNIMVHAYQGEPEHWIKLAAEVHSDRVEISLTHAGIPFDPTLVSPPTFDGSRESGFGVYLIRRCVENVNYACDEKGINRITLVKVRRPIPGEP